MAVQEAGDRRSGSANRTWQGNGRGTSAGHARRSSIFSPGDSPSTPSAARERQHPSSESRGGPSCRSPPTASRRKSETGLPPTSAGSRVLGDQDAPRASNTALARSTSTGLDRQVLEINHLRVQEMQRVLDADADLQGITHRSGGIHDMRHLSHFRRGMQHNSRGRCRALCADRRRWTYEHVAVDFDRSSSAALRNRRPRLRPRARSSVRTRRRSAAPAEVWIYLFAVDCCLRSGATWWRRAVSLPLS